jgi:exodeoxyribonuclease VII small subunit
MKKRKDPSSYEAAYQELQEVLQRLRTEKVKVDELTEMVERAKHLIRYCREQLRSTESLVEQLLEEE